jgi:acyl dehydratase
VRTFPDIDSLRAAKGDRLGPTDWRRVTQEQVNAFADATGDHQWIHVDVERAAAGPFGGTIAHGFLMLSLLPVFLQELYRIDGVTMAVNYGLNKVRFPSALPVGSRVRAGMEVTDVVDVPMGVQLVINVVLEIEGQPKPACVAEQVVLLVP